MNVTPKLRIIHALINHNDHEEYDNQISEEPLNICSFECVHEVDLSNCLKVDFNASITWFQIAFPSLKILRASHCLHFTMENLLYLIRRCSLIREVDLSVDVSVITPTVTVMSGTTERYRRSDGKKCIKLERETSLLYTGNCFLVKPVMANISKLVLEGRNDVDDSNLSRISVLCDSLIYLNIRGCTLVTDLGISNLLSKCRKVQSLILSYTSFGRASILTLCSSHAFSAGFHEITLNHKFSDMMAFGLHELHLDGCKGIDHNSMSQLMSHTYKLKYLSLRDTCVIDDDLCEFMGSSLESLDISETMVSVQALIYIIKRNPQMKCLKATSCRELQEFNCNSSLSTSRSTCDKLCRELGNGCVLEELAFGWGFSSFQLEVLRSAISNLRAITVGLGASLDSNTLYAIPQVCYQLESINLIFQVIGDNIVRNILQSLEHLQVLSLRCCLGDLTSSSLQMRCPTLRTLRLEWVTPWMTNEDMIALTQNCPNLVELALSGCKALDFNSQEIISSGWPGLTLIHMENCGKVTSDGVSSLFGCKAIEDLLLRHNGRGLQRNFVSDAASKLPLLRKLALDLCDASDGGFDGPSHDERFNLRNVRICRCAPQKCGFEPRSMDVFKPVHKETIVLEWTSKDLRTTIVKERV